jgi:hypothetical protein
LYVLDAKSGRQLSVKAFHNPFSVSPPVLVGRSLVVANSSVLFAIPLSEMDAPARAPGPNVARQ